MVRLAFNCSRQGSTNACNIQSRLRRLVSRRLLRVLLRLRRHRRRASLLPGRNRGTTRRGISRSTRRRVSRRGHSLSSSNSIHGNRCPCSKRNSESIQAKKSSRLRINHLRACIHIDPHFLLLPRADGFLTLFFSSYSYLS